MQKIILKSWRFFFETLAILNRPTAQGKFFWGLPLIISLLIAFCGLLPFVPQIFSLTDKRLEKIQTILMMYVLFFTVTLISNFFNAAFLYLLRGFLEGQPISGFQGVRKTFKISADIVIYSLVCSIIQLIYLIFNMTLNLVFGLIIAPMIIQKISVKRKGLPLTLQLNMCLPIMVSENLHYEKARHRAIKIITETWGKNLSETNNITPVLVVTIVPLVFLIGIPLLIMGMMGKHSTLLILGWAIIFLAVILSQVFNALCSQIYAFAAYRYSVEGKNDLYSDASIAPNAYRQAI
ncbi:DUF6159 family protein [Gloeothece verrucosa]|uniref:Uncharacterized protein n=1 Tax=Gloeothece verrucosa (strain PCC 7822) TaxID=497965 RepID=E0UJ37_GLOV7|nr:DUF6159 family protein [Gloeothece verrucosa]ADN15740.1 hypothetical protein Cyan7822_3806 [Gloeothece verrucosa PCC 7822]